MSQNKLEIIEYIEKSDYDDFYIAVKSDVVKQLENAKMFVQYIEKFINEEIV